jgi:DNA-binding PadR family transcriptional regulator
VAQSKTEDPGRLLPLAPLHFHTLIALTEGERHGYAIKKSIVDSSAGRLKPGAGSLYNAIKGLLAEALIEETGERPDPHLDDERRRYYRITQYGQEVVRAEVDRLAVLLRRTRKLPGFAPE